jgi:hypothetical protein
MAFWRAEGQAVEQGAGDPDYANDPANLSDETR